MSLEKAIEHGKEKRKPYRGPKASCSSCRNNSGCEYCKRNRLFDLEKMKLKVRDEFKYS